MDFKASRNYERRKEVFFGVVPFFENWNLGAGYNDRFSESFQHEGERRSGVGQSVGSVKNYKTVVVFVIFLQQKCVSFALKSESFRPTSTSFAILIQSLVVMSQESYKGSYSLIR